MDEKTIISSTPVVWPGWRTGDKLGEGSYGAVYEIHRTVNGVEEKAALKVMSIPQSSAEAASLQEEGYTEEEITLHFLDCLRDIEREYQIMDEFRGHKNIVSCDRLRKLEHADTYGWDIYIKMELLTPMMRYLDRKYGNQLVLPEEEVLKVGMDLCNALVVCAEHKLIHRDIKPQNILVSDEGDYKLGDFGTARTIESSTGLTGGIGSKNYMSPEVASSLKYDLRADIYSAGLVLYWMLNERRLPFYPLPPVRPTHLMTMDALQRRLGGDPLPLPAHGSEELQQIVMRACAFEKEERWKSAQEMLDALYSVYAEHVYQNSVEKIRAAASSEQLKICAGQLEQLGDYRDAEELAKACRAKSAELEKEENYQKLLHVMGKAETLDDLMACAEQLQSLGDYRQASQLRSQCLERAEQLRRELAERQRLEQLEAAYQEALHQMQQAKSAEDYRSAADAFAALADYRDATEQEKKCRDAAAELVNHALYKQAIAAAKTKDRTKLQRAIELFERLGAYEDASRQTELCRQKLEQLQGKNNAKVLPLGIALVLLLAIGLGSWFGFSHRKDVPNQPAERVNTNATELKVGDYITLGTYPQTAAGDDETPIEWLVLDVDPQDNKALLISRYALDCKKYNKEGTSVTWETSSLRSWLNKEFLSKAFSSSEQSGIVSTKVTADQNPNFSTDPGSDTQDKVFLLSIPEVNQYFSSDEARKCAPTEYAIAQGAWTSSSITSGGKATCWWWLRSPGRYSSCSAVNVLDFGSVYVDGDTVSSANDCVRPALWINLDSEFVISIESENTEPEPAVQESTEAAVEPVAMKDVAVGDYVSFGTYPQTAAGDDETPIEWLVLAKEDNKALLISRYALDCKTYHETWGDVTWETCSLRSWLNNDFLNRAFGESEQKAIQTTTVTADKNPYYDTDPGKDTQDKIFLLSIPEKNYFSSDEACRCAPTEYAKEKGAWTSDSYTAGGKATCWWWLRSPGVISISAADVYSDGSVIDYGNDVTHSDFCVRPALWVDLESGIFKS